MSLIPLTFGGWNYDRTAALQNGRVRIEGVDLHYIQLAYTVVPPQIDRSKPAHQQADPTYYAGAVAESAEGITIKGAQMLGTGATLADYIQLSCIHPRRSYAEAATIMFDYPLATRFDETDSLLVYDDVFVPWEDVFICKDIALTRASFFETAAHLLGNNQAQIRFAVKLKFLAGWRAAWPR